MYCTYNSFVVTLLDYQKCVSIWLIRYKKCCRLFLEQSSLKCSLFLQQNIVPNQLCMKLLFYAQISDSFKYYILSVNRKYLSTCTK